MKAKYFRYLFHEVTDGLCYSGSISNQMEDKREDLCFLYLAGGETCGEKEHAFASKENSYQFLILGDTAPAALKRACKVAGCCEVEEFLIPGGEEKEVSRVIALLTQAGAKKVRVIKEEEELHMCREYFRIVPADRSGMGTLMLYHADEAGTPQKEECVMSVKPTMEGMACLSKADHNRLSCEMSCLLYNDFTLCKRHNQGGCRQFLDGHFLCASVKAEAVPELIRRYRERIRFVGLGEKNLTSREAEMVREIGKKGFARYLAGSEKMEAEVVKTMMTGDPHRQFFATGTGAGLCITGYYVPRKQETANP